MAHNSPYIHVTSDRQVQNLIEIISKTHVVRLCVSSRGRTRIVGDANIDGNQDGEDVDEVSYEEEEEDYEDINEVKNEGEEDANFFDAAEVDDEFAYYNVCGKVKDEDEDEDEDEEEADDIYFEGFKETYASEGGSSNGTSFDNIYVNQIFVNRDALVSELRLSAVKQKFSFKIYKATKTLLVARCRVTRCGWKVRASVKHEKKHILGNQVSENSYMFWI